MARGGSRDRLDQPIAPGRRRLRGPTVDPEAFGQATERIARFLGTGKYLVYQSAIIAVWVIYNVTAPVNARFDPYPLQFLTLILSLQAAYAAPLILLAQNRQDDRDRVNNLEDRQQANRNLEDTEFLARELADIRLALGEAVTRDFLRTELRDLLEEVVDRAATTPGELGLAAPVGVTPKKQKKRRRAPAPRPEPGDTALSEPQRPDREETSAEGVTGET